MGDNNVGGGGSVKWVVDVDSPDGKPKSEPKASGGHHQEGVDKTPPNAKFTVTIDRPADSQGLVDLLNALSAWVDDPTEALTFHLPIEKNNEDQIRIHWPSQMAGVAMRRP